MSWQTDRGAPVVHQRLGVASQLAQRPGADLPGLAAHRRVGAFQQGARRLDRFLAALGVQQVPGCFQGVGFAVGGREVGPEGFEGCTQGPTPGGGRSIERGAQGSFRPGLVPGRLEGPGQTVRKPGIPGHGQGLLQQAGRLGGIARGQEGVGTGIPGLGRQQRGFGHAGERLGGLRSPAQSRQRRPAHPQDPVRQQREFAFQPVQDGRGADQVARLQARHPQQEAEPLGLFGEAAVRGQSQEGRPRTSPVARAGTFRGGLRRRRAVLRRQVVHRQRRRGGCVGRHALPGQGDPWRCGGDPQRGERQEGPGRGKRGLDSGLHGLMVGQGGGEGASRRQRGRIRNTSQ